MARSEILLDRNPEDLSERVLFLIKCSEREAQAISYRCDGFFEWSGLSDLTPQDLGKAPQEERKSANREQAEEWLLERLSEGPVMVQKIMEDASKQDPPIKERMLRVLKKDLGIESIRITEGNNGNGDGYGD